MRWFNRGKNRDTHAQTGGHNVTPTFVHFDAPNFRSNSDPICGAAPNLPYKLRRRMVRELEEGEGVNLFSEKCPALNYLLFVLGLAFFAAVLYFGVGYYYDTCNAYGTFESGGVQYGR